MSFYQDANSQLRHSFKIGWRMRWVPAFPLKFQMGERLMSPRRSLVHASLHVCLGLLVLYPVMTMAKLRLFIRVRKQGSRIESVPLKRLVELSGYRKKNWEFKDGWLILEAF